MRQLFEGGLHVGTLGTSKSGNKLGLLLGTVAVECIEREVGFVQFVHPGGQVGDLQPGSILGATQVGHHVGDGSGLFALRQTGYAGAILVGYHQQLSGSVGNGFVGKAYRAAQGTEKSGENTVAVIIGRNHGIGITGFQCLFQGGIEPFKGGFKLLFGRRQLQRVYICGFQKTVNKTHYLIKIHQAGIG